MNDLRRRRLRKLDLLVIAVFFFGVLTRQYILWTDRGMFENDFRRPERGILLRWVPSTQITDTHGNGAIADYHLNLLVLFKGEKVNGPRLGLGLPVPTPGGVNISSLQGNHTSSFFIPETRDALLIYRPDGTRERLPLGPVEARRIFGYLNYETVNIVPIIEREYAKGRSCTKKAGNDSVSKPITR